MMEKFGSKVIMDLYHKHMAAARSDNEVERRAIFFMIEELRRIYPEAAAEIDAKYSNRPSPAS